MAIIIILKIRGEKTNLILKFQFGEQPLNILMNFIMQNGQTSNNAISNNFGIIPIMMFKDISKVMLEELTSALNISSP